jgi:hypothetical protein
MVLDRPAQEWLANIVYVDDLGPSDDELDELFPPEDVEAELTQLREDGVD